MKGTDIVLFQLIRHKPNAILIDHWMLECIKNFNLTSETILGIDEIKNCNLGIYFASFLVHEVLMIVLVTLVASHAFAL